MGRHGYDRSNPPPFDPALGAALARSLKRLLAVSLAAVGLEVLLGAATAFAGPAHVRWLVVLGGRGGGSIIDLSVSTTSLPVVLVALTLPGALAAFAFAMPLNLRILARQPHRGLPAWTVAGVVLMHMLTPSLALAALSAWVGWSPGTYIAAFLPQAGSIALVVVLASRRRSLDPWVWADPLSRRGRRSRARWAAVTAPAAPPGAAP